MKRLLILLHTLLPALMLAIPTNAMADTPLLLGTDEAQVAASTITQHYGDWQKVTLSGKLHLDNLPISPSVKIYMERARRIVISLRAPLLGEVGTVDITPQSATLVNKMKRNYCELTLTEFMADLPVTLSDLQDMFLARIFLPDSGTLSMDNYSQADFYAGATDAGWFVLPKNQPVEYDVSCGYTTLGDGRTQNIFVTTLDGKDQAGALYEYSGKNTDVALTLRYKGKDHNFGLTLSQPEWEGKSINPATIDERYKKLTLREFFKNL